MIVDIRNENKVGNYIIFFLTIICMLMLLKITKLYNDSFQNFSTIFISIVLEAIPFVILGAFIAAFINLYISEDFIKKILPKNRVGSILVASLLGMFFPVCECAIVPIVKNLIRKGVPKEAAITFMMAVPLVNPIVLLSTYYAFYNAAGMVLLRGVTGFLAAITIGMLISNGRIDVPVLREVDYNGSCDETCTLTEHDHHHHHHNNGNKEGKLEMFIEHAGEEFYETAKLLIIGASLSALFQTFVSKKAIGGLGSDPVLSILVMIALAYLLSICSTADAFIAKTFVSQFTLGGVIAFMVMGPMLDIKNTFMLMGAFRGSFVVRLITCILAVCFTAGICINLLVTFGVVR